VDKEELAWAGGLFEGEGTIGCWRNTGGRHFQFVSRLMITDEDVIYRFVDAVRDLVFLQVHEAKRLYGSEKKIRYTVSTSNYKSTSSLINGLWPYLGQRRRNQYEDALLKYQEWSKPLY